VSHRVRALRVAALRCYKKGAEETDGSARDVMNENKARSGFSLGVVGAGGWIRRGRRRERRAGDGREGRRERANGPPWDGKERRRRRGRR